MEADCLVDGLTRAKMHEMLSVAEVTWPGYRMIVKGGTHTLTYPEQPWNIQGSHCLSFRGAGLVKYRKALSASPRYCHIDYLLSRSLKTLKAHIPSRPSMGTRAHASVIHGKGEVILRKGTSASHVLSEFKKKLRVKM